MIQGVVVMASEWKKNRFPLFVTGCNLESEIGYRQPKSIAVIWPIALRYADEFRNSFSWSQSVPRVFPERSHSDPRIMPK